MRKRSSAGFSLDVCGVLIVANVTRVVYWMGERFQLARKNVAGLLAGPT